jgi:hypothetical protein
VHFEGVVQLPYKVQRAYLEGAALIRRYVVVVVLQRNQFTSEPILLQDV